MGLACSIEPGYSEAIGQWRNNRPQKYPFHEAGPLKNAESTGSSTITQSECLNDRSQWETLKFQTSIVEGVNNLVNPNFDLAQR